MPEEQVLQSEHYVLVTVLTNHGGGHSIVVGPFTTRGRADLAATNFEAGCGSGDIIATPYFT